MEKNIFIASADEKLKGQLKEFFEAEVAEYRMRNSYVVTTSLFKHASDLIQSITENINKEDTVEPLVQLPNLIIFDSNVLDLSPISFIDQMRSIDREIPIIVLVTKKNEKLGIRSVKKGAFDFCEKPIDFRRFEISTTRAFQIYNLVQKFRRSRSIENIGLSFDPLVGESDEMTLIKRSVDKAANSTANVLISGENGTEKESVAFAIHQKSSRVEFPFITINGANPHHYFHNRSFESSVQGLFQDAQGGTLFINNIDELDIESQDNLLKFLQTHKIKLFNPDKESDLDVRVVAATRRDLEALTETGSFRKTLYLLVNIVPIVIPPLRHRKEDIEALLSYFLQKFSQINKSSVNAISREAIEELKNRKWEGNVRELEAFVERTMVMTSNRVVTLADIPSLGSRQADDFFSSSAQDLPSLAQLEERYIKYVLEKTGGKKEMASRVLGITRRTLYRKEREYEIVPDNK